MVSTRDGAVLETLGFSIALLALIISGITAWLTLLRRGTVRMTQPTVVWFGPDGGRPPNRPPQSKIFLRTLLYSTAERGQILENMFVRIRRKGDVTTFGIWVYGDQVLARGSGLHVGKDGIAANHHFLLGNGRNYVFSAGRYDLEVFVTRAGKRRPRSLWQLSIVVTADLATALSQGGTGLYFDWNPEEQVFETHLDIRPATASASWLPPTTP